MIPEPLQSPAPSRYLTAALYKFVALPDCEALKEPLQAVCDANGVKGTLLLATEGINGTISGLPGAVGVILAHLRADARLADLAHKQSWAQEMPFLRMKVRVKKEIVTLGVPGVSPTLMAGQYVKPRDWNALISDPEVVLIDTRNDYEVDIGSFQGAVDPRLKTFADLPDWVAAQEKSGGALQCVGDAPDAAGKGGKKPKVAMFCTGGIRCEKSTAYLRQKGYDEVYHLEGGILKYLEDVPASQSLWQGECFVFDERVSVGHGLAPGPYELCRSCRHPVGDAERALPKYEKGVSCPRCFDSRSDDDKRAFAERQRQVDLARSRGVAHVGAKMPEKPKRLADPVQHLLDLLAQAARDGNRRRILIALAGLPGSGKTIFSNELVNKVNVESRFEIAIALGMDGFHLSKSQLATFADPAEAFKRRGAPWTFDPVAMKERLQRLRQTTEGQPATVTWPGFEHGIGDPVANAITVGPQVQLVIVEGLYLLKEGDGWDLADAFDERWYLDVPMKLAMQRLVQRHMAVNGNTQDEAERRLAVNDRLNAQIVLKTRARAQWWVR
jgi:UPF0176 protein